MKSIRSDATDVEHMPWEENQMLEFIIGSSYKRSKIHDAWGGQRQGGISTPKDHPVIFLFSADRGSEFGYHDGWHEDGFFHYSGEGQEGDMQEIRGNAAIINHAKDGKQLLVFQTIKDGSRKFIGPMDYVDHYYHDAEDMNGNTRKAIMFRLTQLRESNVDSQVAGIASTKTDEALDVLREKALEASSLIPDKKSSAREYYERSATVAKYVLARAAGKCELCGKEAPFLRKDGTPYLEPHHIQRLADEGPDYPNSIAALCPNCHREVHYGIGSEQLNSTLKERICALEEEFYMQELRDKEIELNNEHKEIVRAYLEEYLLSKGVDTSKNFKCITNTHEDENRSMSLDRDRQRACCSICGAELDIFDAIGVLEHIKLKSEQYVRGYLWAGYDFMGYPIYYILRFRTEEEIMKGYSTVMGNGKFKVTIYQGDITRSYADAIVNAANSSLMGGGGVDGAIHLAAGRQLANECYKIREDQYPDGLPTGEAIATKAYKLHSKIVIHTVGPNCTYERIELLEKCYINSLKVAEDNKCESIAFPAISTGIYRCPVGKSAEIVKKVLISYAPTSIKEVLLVLFSKEDYEIYKQVFENDSNYGG